MEDEKKNIGIVSVYIGRPSIWGNPFVNKFVAAKYPWRGPRISVNDPVTAHKRWLSGEAWTKTLQKQRKEVLKKNR